MQNLLRTGVARPPEVWLAKDLPGYWQHCIGRGLQDPANSWVPVTVRMPVEPLAPVFQGPCAKKADSAGAEICFQSSGRTSCEVWIGQKQVFCENQLLIQEDNQGIALWFMHFIAFVHFPVDCIYDVVKHRGEQILICGHLLKGTWGKWDLPNTQ